MKTTFRPLVAAIAVWAAFGALEASTPALAPSVLAAPALADLRSVDELKALFNHDHGKTRLVLLLSPT